MVHVWVPRVPRIVHLCMSKLVRTLRLWVKGAIYGYHGYQHKSFQCVCLCIGYNGGKYVLNSCVCRAISGYHGYHVYFFCGDVFFLWVPRVPSMSCIGVWGSDIWVPRVPAILLLSG